MSWKERAKLVPEQGKEAVTTSWKDRASRVGEPSNPTLEASQPSPNSVFSNSAVPSQEPLEQQDLSNPPTPLSAAVHGFGSGLSYNFLDEAAGLIDSKAKDRIKASKQEFPTLFNIASVLGAVLSPNPVSKLKAVKEAGTAAKMAINAANFGGQVGLQAIGGSEKEGLKRLEDAKEALTDPITIGLGVLSAGAPLAIAKISKNADSIVTHGGKSFKLGKEVKDAIGSEAGQLYASRAVNQFGKDVIDEGYNSFKALAPKMDEVAAMNADNIVDLKGPLTSAYSKVIKKGSEQLEELGPDSLAMNNKLNRWLESAEAKFLSNSPEKISSKARFADVYEKKAELGRMIWEQKSFVRDPSINKTAKDLYFGMMNQLTKADKSGQFKILSDTNKGVLNTLEAAEDLGQSLASQSNLGTTAVEKRDALVNAYKQIPDVMKSRLQGLGSLINNKMDDVLTTYRVSAKVSGKDPNGTAAIISAAKGIPVLGESSRLGFLNRLGREANPESGVNQFWNYTNIANNLPQAAGRALNQQKIESGERGSLYELE